jgi:hypothetical protein
MTQISIAKFILLCAALTLAVPESYAKRVGGGRSAGRQSQMMRQRAAPVPPVQRQQAAPVPSQPVPPVASQRSVPPPVAPSQPIRRQHASSGFGGFFTGALIGMGLGSLISSNNQNQNPANQSSGSSGDWDNASGNDGQQANATQQTQHEGNPFGVLLLLGIAALAVRYMVRRNRAKQRNQGFARNGFR